MPDLDFYDSQAELYESAFSWDVEEEVAWLASRFGPGARSVMEPFCGNGRLFPAFARRGLETAGVDLSSEMLARAAAAMRAAGHAPPLLLRADTRDFDFGRTFDGAFCPVNSLGYLHTQQDVVRHLDCVARHLAPGGRYLVQLGLRNVDDFRPLEVTSASLWEVETPRGRLQTTWKSGGFDRARRVETQISRFEWITGPHAGQSAEFEHSIRVRDWKDWSEVLAASKLREVAAWDGDARDWPAIPVGPELEGHLLAWHELERSDGAASERAGE